MKRDYGIYRAGRDEMRTDWKRLQAKYRSDQVRFLKEEEEATHVEMDREEFLRELESQILAYSKIKQLTEPNSVRKGNHFKMVDSLNMTVAELKKEKIKLEKEKEMQKQAEIVRLSKILKMKNLNMPRGSGTNVKTKKLHVELGNLAMKVTGNKKKWNRTQREFKNDITRLNRLLEDEKDKNEKLTSMVHELFTLKLLDSDNESSSSENRDKMRQNMKDKYYALYTHLR